MSFFQYFFSIDEDREEAVVPCIFPHQTSNGVEYYEQNPSAHINTEKNLYHCKSCGRGYSEPKFITEVLGCSYSSAIKLQMLFNNTEDKVEWDRCTLQRDTLNKILSFNISPEVVDKLALKTGLKPDTIAFPVFLFNKLVDVRMYNPGGKPKMKSRAGAPAGLVIPYDIWRTDKKRTTIICAGEKDMAVARSHNFNAITITGGETALPILLKEFENRKVIICYDNDEAGMSGARRLAAYLSQHCESAKICTGFHEVCKEQGEDLTDFFNKYGKRRNDLITYLRQAVELSEPEKVLNSHYPLMDLYQASRPDNTNKTVRTNIQVVAISEASYTMPDILIAEKFRQSSDQSRSGDTMKVGERRVWELTEDTLKDTLHLIDNNFNESILQKNYKKLTKIPMDEKYIRMIKPSKKTVYKAYVTDMFETQDGDVVPMEYLAYTVGCKLEAGKKYLSTYRLVPHPYKGQQLTMIITDVTEANDSVSNFKITPEVKEHLKYFQEIPGTVEERLKIISEKFKHYLGYNGSNQLITMLDLAFHTVYGFNFGSYTNERGYLDTLIVGESRVGKSTTANAMREVYGLGSFVSLAGNAATVAGLIGGSNKLNGTFQTRAGVIPQNHKGLLIFEELSKTNTGIIRELTDIRSSGVVRISRVSGSISLPSRVRYITLSNAKSIDGVTKPLCSYPNGISIVHELIGTAEDIARYDVINILPNETVQSNPLWKPQDPIELGNLRTRIRWVWSRDAEEVVFADGVPERLTLIAAKLAETYNCHVKIFGVETWKKLARLSIAIAGCLCSTGDDCTEIKILAEHVDYAEKLLVSLYDNDQFKLMEYVKDEQKYATIDDDGVHALQNIWNRCPAILLYLEGASSATKNSLQAASGLSNDEYNGIMTRLIQGLFVKIVKYDMVPTVRFRLGMAKIDRVRLTRIGEP